MSNKFLEKTGLGVDGHVLVKDADTGEVLIDKYNAINFENFALGVASLFASKDAPDGGTFAISSMAFGNGGTVIDSAGNISYRVPSVDTQSGHLYTETYRKIIQVDDMEVIAYTNEVYSDIVTTVTLDYSEPADQDTLDDSANVDGDYVFDELGLVTRSGLFITHLIFHPIHKSANRKIQVIYTIRIRAGQ